MRFLFWALGVALASANSARAGVFINEVQSSNDTTCTDENGESQDWIELYNSGDAAVDLGGWALTDKEGKPGNWWYFPKGTQIGVKDYLVVYADKTGTAGPPADDGEGDVPVVKDSLAPDDASIRGNLVAWYRADDLDSVVYNVFPTESAELLTGRVTDVNGRPVVGATVTGTKDGTTRSARTDEHGVYALRVSKGKWTVDVSVPGGTKRRDGSVDVGTSMSSTLTAAGRSRAAARSSARRG